MAVNYFRKKMEDIVAYYILVTLPLTTKTNKPKNRPTKRVFKKDFYRII